MWDLNSWLWQCIKSIIIFRHRIWGGFLPTTHSLNLRNSELNYVPRPRTVSAKGSLHYRESVLWNKIPSENRKLPNLNVFKPSFYGKDFSNTPQWYRMVPFNLTALAKFWLYSNCLDECSLARARKIFASARMLGFLLKFPAVYRKYNLHLETKTGHWKQCFLYGKLRNIGETCARHECFWKKCFLVL